MAEEAVTWLAMHFVEEIHFITKKHRLISKMLDWLKYGKPYKHPDYEAQTLLHKIYWVHEELPQCDYCEKTLLNNKWITITSGSLGEHMFCNNACHNNFFEEQCKKTLL
jgi:hypothetical protein